MNPFKRIMLILKAVYDAWEEGDVERTKDIIKQNQLEEIVLSLSEDDKLVEIVKNMINELGETS